MQCNQPFNSNGLSTFGKYYKCNQVVPYNNMVPEILGEGEVIPSVAPDGTVQFFFVPRYSYFGSYPYNSPDCYQAWTNNIKQVWYITNYPKQTSLPLTIGQTEQAFYFPRCGSIDCNMISPEKFHLKFHNDAWSSTTDLHYFIPLTRTCDWSIPQTCNAITQIEVPNNFSHCQIVCDRPCHCPPNFSKGKELDRVECHCCNLHRKDSPMAIDSKSEACCGSNIESAKERKKHDRIQCQCNKRLHKDSQMALDSKSDKKSCDSNIVHLKDACKCTSHGDTKPKTNDNLCVYNERKSNNIDKLVTTYTDQGSGCIADVCCETQKCDTLKHAGTITKVEKIDLDKVKAEIWQPKTATSKKAMETKISSSFLKKSENTADSCSCTDTSS